MERYIEGWGEPFPIPVIANGVDQQLYGPQCRLVGWSLRETTGAAPGTVAFFTGGGNNGVQVGEQSLTIGASETIAIPDGGVVCDAGLFLKAVAGTVRGAAWVRARVAVEV